MIAVRLLHVLARVAVRVRSPLEAKALVDAAGALFPPYASSAHARRDAAAIARSGTCLTRALAIAARLPDSAVVIAAKKPSAFAAHAWVERASGERISDDDEGFEWSTNEIVRLKRGGASFS